METTSIDSSGDEGVSSELPNFALQFFEEPPAKSKRFANLSEHELSQLQRHSEKTKKSTDWSVKKKWRACNYRVMDAVGRFAKHSRS